MTIKYTVAVKQARMGAVKTALETGSGTACIKVYTTPMPSTPADPPSGATLLVTHDINNPAGTVDSNGDLVLSLASESTVAADGAPYWARFLDRDGVTVCDALTGLPGSGADVEIGASLVYAGGKLTPTTTYLRDG